jgi:hypothetical protein
MATTHADLQARLDDPECSCALMKDQDQGMLSLEGQLLGVANKLNALDVTASISSLNPLLPPELLEHVLDSHEGDIESLKVFSLVCRDWAAYTRRYRLTRIELFRDGPRTDATLLEFLEDMPCIRPHIQALTFNRYCNLRSGWSDKNIDTLLPRLRSVRFRSGSWRIAWSLRIMERLGHLDTLFLEGAFAKDGSDLASDGYRSNLSIKRLSVIEPFKFDTERVWDWLRNTRTIEQQSLTSLALSYGRDHNLARSKDVLLKIIHASPRLEGLELHLARCLHVPALMSSTFSTHTNPQHSNLNFVSFSFSGMGLGTVPIIKLTLATQPSTYALQTFVRFINATNWPNLRHLEIKIISGFPGYKPENVVCQSFRAVGRDNNSLPIRPELLADLNRITVCFIDMGKVAHVHRVFRMFGPALEREGLIDIKLENSTLVT